MVENIEPLQKHAPKLIRHTTFPYSLSVTCSPVQQIPIVSYMPASGRSRSDPIHVFLKCESSKNSNFQIHRLKPCVCSLGIWAMFCCSIASTVWNGEGQSVPFTPVFLLFGCFPVFAMPAQEPDRQLVTLAQ